MRMISIGGGGEGPGVVRNIGMDRADGEYIYFMDNDDVLMPDALHIMLKAAVETGADVVINTKNFLVEQNKFMSLDEIPRLLIQERGKMNPIAADLKKRLTEEYAQKCSPAAPWLHLYRREYLLSTGLRFKKAVIHDDGIWLLEILCSDARIVKIAEPLYILRSRDSSLSHSTAGNFEGFSKRVESFLIMLENFGEILSQAFMRVYGEPDYYFIDTLCLAIKNRAIVGPMRHAYNASPVMCWRIINEQLEARYGSGSETELLRKMMHGYFIEATTKSGDTEEKLRLCATMKHIKNEINRLIPF